MQLLSFYINSGLAATTLTLGISPGFSQSAHPRLHQPLVIANIGNDAEAYNTQGLENYRRQQWDSALVNFTKAIELNRDYADAYENRGLLYHRQQKLDLALADFNRAIQLSPENPRTYYNLSNVHCRPNYPHFIH